jgi:hypothetical protein
MTKRLTPQSGDPQGLVEAQQMLTLLQGGGLTLGGLRLTIRDTVPTTAPASGAPAVVLVRTLAILVLYAWNGPLGIWQALTPRLLAGATSWTPGLLAANTAITTTITVTGVVVEDTVVVSNPFGLDSAYAVLSATVTAADTVTVSLLNASAAGVNFASARTVKVWVFRQ